MSSNIFDKITILPSSANSITEETLYTDTGVDSQKVINNVMNSIGIKKTNKKPKILKRVLIAAAVCALVFGVVSLPIVAENLYILYGNIFGGDKYTADFESIGNADVKISDPNLQLASLNVSGNGGMDDLIDIRLSKKNGDRFTYSEFNVVKQGNVLARIENNEDPNFEQKHDLDVVIGKDRQDNASNSLNGLEWKALYGLEEDGKILRILIDLNAITDGSESGSSLEGSLQGRKISIRSYSYSLASVDNTLGTFDSMNDECLESALKLQNDNVPAFTYDLWTNSYYYSDIIYKNDSFDVVSGRIKTVSLPFEITFTMDYGNKDSRIPVSSELLTKAFVTKTENGQISVSPIGITLSAKTEETATRPDMNRCYIVTKTGEKYYLIASRCIYKESSVMMNCKFGSISENMGSMFDKKLYLIDPNNVKEIVINGIIVYDAK